MHKTVSFFGMFSSFSSNDHSSIYCRPTVFNHRPQGFQIIIGFLFAEFSTVKIRGQIRSEEIIQSSIIDHPCMQCIQPEQLQRFMKGFRFFRSYLRQTICDPLEFFLSFSLGLRQFFHLL